MKINIIAPGFLGTSGYANHSKGLSNALSEFCDVKVTIQPIANWNLMVNDTELRLINKEDSSDRINVIIDLPQNWKQYCNKKFNIGFLVWEGDKIPLSWIDCIENPDIKQVWVPSTHVFLAIKETVMEATTDSYLVTKFMQKIKIVPHGFNPQIFKPLLRDEQRFIFLVNKGFRGELDRGGMQHAIRAFVQEFNKGEAILFLKLNPAYALPPEVLTQIINKYVLEAGKTKDTCPDIAFSYDNMSQEKLCELYNTASILLNPTEAEAFSLPCIESMACGKPVITTNFGGQTDFVNNHNGWLIDGKLHEVTHELIYEGIKWMEPNIADLRNAMRDAFKNTEMRINKGKEALKDSVNWTWKNSALKAMEALNSLAMRGGD